MTKHVFTTVMCFNNYMATTQQTADFIIEQLKNVGEVYARKMFGEFGLYCDGRVFDFICDDILFVKPTILAPNFLRPVATKLLRLYCSVMQSE